jgi:hypothetical protein
MAQTSLLHGQKIAVQIQTRVGRAGCDGVRVRVIGDLSYAWAEMVLGWGAHLEAVVPGSRQLMALLKFLADVPVVSFQHV